jgi:hypothetical protein
LLPDLWSHPTVTTPTFVEDLGPPAHGDTAMINAAVYAEAGPSRHRRHHCHHRIRGRQHRLRKGIRSGRLFLTHYDR